MKLKQRRSWGYPVPWVDHEEVLRALVWAARGEGLLPGGPAVASN